MNDQTKLQRKKKTQRSISRNIITKYIVFEEKKIQREKTPHDNNCERLESLQKVYVFENRNYV